MADEFTGDMSAAVEAAFSASTPDAGSTTTGDTTTPAATAPAPEIVTQAALVTTEPVEGPVPYPRFKEVNDGYQASKKELEALAWAKGIRPEHAPHIAQFYNRVSQNPIAMLDEVDALLADPRTAPAVRSWAARTLGTRTASREAPAADVMPEPDLVFEDGRKAYSAERQQQRDQWLLKQFESQIDAKLAPLAERGKAVDQIVADKAYATIQSQAERDARTEIDTLKQQPHFEEHRKDIAAAMEAHPDLTLRQAWAQVFTEKVIPQLAGHQAATVKAKVQAGSANPARPSGAAASAPKDFHDALSAFFPVRN